MQESNNTKPSVMFCPLLNQEITDLECFEIVFAVDGFVKMSSVPETQNFSRDEARGKCNKKDCPYHYL